MLTDYKISPFELESLLIEHVAVVEAAVVPSPDAQRLSVPKAFVILAAGVTPSPEVAAAILNFVRARTSPFKRIRRIEFTDLPKTVSGKIRRVDYGGPSWRAIPARPPTSLGLPHATRTSTGRKISRSRAGCQ